MHRGVVSDESPAGNDGDWVPGSSAKPKSKRTPTTKPKATSNVEAKPASKPKPGAGPTREAQTNPKAASSVAFRLPNPAGARKKPASTKRSAKKTPTRASEKAREDAAREKAAKTAAVKQSVDIVMTKTERLRNTSKGEYASSMHAVVQKVSEDISIALTTLLEAFKAASEIRAAGPAVIAGAGKARGAAAACMASERAAASDWT